MTPYYDWRQSHLLHHESSGNHSKPEILFNSTIVNTVKEYNAFPQWKRRVYRILRDPLFFFTIAPSLLFFIYYRFVRGSMIANIGITVMYIMLYYFGSWNLVSLHAISMMFASSTGFFLFHTQHSYNPSYVTPLSGKYDRFDASIIGSSLLPIPAPLNWFTYGIEYHHIHHLTTAIPGYNLQKAHYAAPPNMWKHVYVFDSFAKIWDSLKLVLWDDNSHRFVSFGDLKQCQ